MAVKQHYVGIDPDLHNMGIGVLDPQGKPLGAYCIKVHKKFKRTDAVLEMVKCVMEIRHWDMPFGTKVIVEDQDLSYTTNKGANPKDILLLGQVAGACVAATCLYTPVLWKPQKWKGSVPKEIHHARLCIKFGWTYEKKPGYCVPTGDLGFEVGFNPSDWKHVMDGLGLARALWEYDTKTAKVDAALTKARGNP